MAVTLADDDEEERYVDIGADGKPIVRVKAEAKIEESEVGFSVMRNNLVMSFQDVG